MCNCVINIFACCLKQIKCLLCGTSCTCCCAFCPNINESTSTRLVYALMLLLITCICVTVMSPLVLKDFFDMPEDAANTTCKDFGYTSDCLILMGSTTVYRISFGTIMFFFLMMILTIGVKTSKSYRAYIHNGFWFWKFGLLVFFIVISFQIDFDGILRELWMYAGMVAASIYIILNMLILIELAYSWTEKMLNRERCKIFWCMILIVLIILFVTISVVLTIYLFMNFVPNQDCFYNNLLISIISTACFAFFLFAILVAAKTRKTYTYLLPTSFVSAYVLLLTWSALTSIPRSGVPEENSLINHLNRTVSNGTSKWCYSHESLVLIDQKFITYTSILLAILLSVYSSIKTSSSSKNLGIEVKSVPEKKICFGCCVQKQKKRIERNKSTGQTLIRNEINGVIYSYSFFHFIFMLAVFHNMMQLTNWTRPDTAHLDTFGQSMPTVYMKSCSAVVCIFVFGATLLASCFCPKKQMTKVKTADDDDNV